MKHIVSSFFYAAVLLGSMQAHAWTVIEDYEDGSLGSRPPQNCRTDCKNSNDVVHSGKQSAKLSISQGSVGKSWGVDFGFPSSLSEGDELWYRAYMYFPSSFDFSSPGSGAKLMRFDSGGKWISILFGPKASGNLKADSEAGGSPFYNQNASSRKSLGNLKKGVWQAIEMYVKFSSKNGQGKFRVWNDGKLVFEDNSTNTLESAGRKSTRALFGTYWNGGSPKTQSLYLDDIVWTTDRPANKDSKGNAFIGVSGFKAAPSEPKKETSPPNPPIVKSN